MADETGRDDKPQGADALQAMQNQLNDLAKDWEAFKADVEKRVAAMETAIAPIGEEIKGIFNVLAGHELELVGADDAKDEGIAVLRALIEQTLGLSSIATQIMANAVQSDITQNQRELNGRTKLLLDMQRELAPSPAEEAAKAAP